VEGSCKHGNEPLGSIKCWKFLYIAEQLAFSQEGHVHVFLYVVCLSQEDGLAVSSDQ
jgi:hypothetical protein